MRALWYRGDLRLARTPLLCPEYPAPVVDHAERRRIAIARFEEARRAAALA